MKYFFLLSTLVATVFLFTQCKKNSTIHNVYFIATQLSETDQWVLFIDGENQGDLINSDENISCSTDDSTLSTLIHLQLPVGKYKIEAKDKIKGTTVSLSNFKLKINSMSNNSSVGQQEIQRVDNCIIFKLVN